MTGKHRKYPVLVENGTQSIILRVIRDHCPVSRTNIVELTGLTHAATSRAVAVLLKKGIVTEDAYADTKGPRRKRGIRLNPDAGHCIAVEYGPWGLEAVVLNTAYEKVYEKRFQVDFKGPQRDKKVQILINFIEEILTAKNFRSHSRCLGIALIDPGVIDFQRQKTVYCSILDDWRDVEIADIVGEKFKIPVMLTNTSMAKIRAVDRLEIRGAVKNLIFIEYGEGIGCGLKLSGNYIAGFTNISGEFGHLRITNDPVICRCGGVGCLEAVAALPVLEAKAKAVLKRNTESILRSNSDISGAAILEAAAQGDRLATHIVEDAFEYLGRAIAGMINILNPEIVVLDGMIQKAGTNAVSVLMRSIQKNALSAHWENAQIKISNLTSFLGPMGGASVILDQIIENKAYKA